MTGIVRTAGRWAGWNLATLAGLIVVGWAVAPNPATAAGGMSPLVMKLGCAKSGCLDDNGTEPCGPVERCRTVGPPVGCVCQ
jgi:hypothetical protein